MKFLIDKNISYRICPYLEAAGHEAAHVDSLALAAADDIEILEHARADAAVIVSADTDFGTLLAAQRAALPSVILTREVSTMPAAELALLLLANLESVADALGAGAVVAIGRRGIRVRRLPLR